MPVNKVTYFGETLIDISDSTVTPEALLKGEIAYDRTGARIEGIATGGGDEPEPPNDGKTRLYFNIPFDGYQLTFKVYGEMGFTQPGKVNWGDGKEESKYISSYTTFSHLYEKSGKYAVEISYDGSFYFTMLSSNNIFGYPSNGQHDITNILEKVYLGGSFAYVDNYCLMYLYGLKKVVVNSPYFEYFGNQAFSNCYGLSQVFVNSNVSRFFAKAFMNCVSLKDVYFRQTTPPVLGSSDVFSGVSSKCIFHIPVGYESDWKSSTNWTVYADQIVGDVIL